MFWRQPPTWLFLMVPFPSTFLPKVGASIISLPIQRVFQCIDYSSCFRYKRSLDLCFFVLFFYFLVEFVISKELDGIVAHFPLMITTVLCILFSCYHHGV
ncbi:hypothetical protein K435DRAFT_318233 [Dendrothele bispora CBS 962.96]|uniref:Uncharacterized protein n=1 Tax=Dendrothele bispora (strain CBS 962.96) TaxID=1314807 RepID=A0A4S8LGC9_DENBC|nr:hypothetical protein K435DRAFT_318233 [Dendrothele bispora CBS 962.96]